MENPQLEATMGFYILNESLFGIIDFQFKYRGKNYFMIMEYI